MGLFFAGKRIDHNTDVPKYHLNDFIIIVTPIRPLTLIHGARGLMALMLITYRRPINYFGFLDF